MRVRVQVKVRVRVRMRVRVKVIGFRVMVTDCDILSTE